MTDNTQTTLVLLKPDAVQRGLVGEITARLEGRGLRIDGMKMLRMDDELAGRHYEAHRERPFFGGLVEFITSGPLVALALTGPDAVALVRTTMGATNPADAAPGTIRGDLAIDIGRNLIHGSDSVEAAERELSLFFGDGETLSYERSSQPWIIEP